MEKELSNLKGVLQENRSQLLARANVSPLELVTKLPGARRRLLFPSSVRRSKTASLQTVARK